MAALIEFLEMVYLACDYLGSDRQHIEGACGLRQAFPYSVLFCICSIDRLIFKVILVGIRCESSVPVVYLYL